MATPTARLSPDARDVLRNAGLLCMGGAVLMALLTFGAMLWMDVPLFLIGLGMAAYALLDARRAQQDARAAAPPAEGEGKRA